MTKEEFLKKLSENLDIFLVEEREKEIDIFRKKIEEMQVKKQLTEEEIIKSFGTIESIRKEILKKHGINYKKVSSKQNLLYQKFEELFTVIHKLVDKMGKYSWQENSLIIINVLVLILLISFIKIPFILIRTIGDSLLTNFASPFVLEIWSLGVELCYIVIAVMVFVNVFTKMFENISFPKKKKKKNQALDSISLNEE